jgi:glutamine cyclotransferase
MTSPVPETMLPLENHWGEGIAARDKELIQLTWRSELAMVYSLPELKPTRSLQYRGEGWGLSACGDGFVMTNGSSTLVFRDQYFAVLRTLPVRTRGIPLRWLNDLTCANGRLYINRLGDNCIYEVDPMNGRVTTILDCSEIVSAESPAGAEDQLNGIAYIEDDDVFVITGKRWKKLYFVAFSERAGQDGKPRA